MNKLELKDDEYYEDPIKAVIFRYRIVNAGPNEAPMVSVFDKMEPKNKKEPRIMGYNLPLPNTSDYTQFGSIFAQNNNIFYINNPLKLYSFKVTVLDGHNLIELYKSNSSNSEVILTVRDYLTDNPKTFKRTVNNLEYYFIEGKLTMKKHIGITQFLTSLKPQKKIRENCVITMDIETYIDEGIVRPFLISYYDGKLSRSFYLSDFKDENEMILVCLISVIKSKYNGYIVYLHNLSKFDSAFIMRHLAKINDNKARGPLMKDGRVIEFRVKLGRVTVKFRDSLLMLPMSLKLLGKSFGVEEKGQFPIFFFKKDTLEYVGKLPDIKYFKEISSEESGIIVKF